MIQQPPFRCPRCRAPLARGAGACSCPASAPAARAATVREPLAFWVPAELDYGVMTLRSLFFCIGIVGLALGVAIAAEGQLGALGWVFLGGVSLSGAWHVESAGPLGRVLAALGVAFLVLAGSFGVSLLPEALPLFAGFFTLGLSLLAFAAVVAIARAARSR